MQYLAMNSETGKLLMNPITGMFVILEESVSDIVFRFSPKVLYGNNTDMRSIYTAQQRTTIDLMDTAEQAANNNYVVRADIDGIRQYESILGIRADEALDEMEMRRKRVLNKLALTIPYTRIFLEQMLEAIFGAGNWSMSVDPVNLTLDVFIVAESPQIYNQTMKDIADLIPANLGFRPSGEVPYTHIYLNRRYTHEQMERFTFGELSKYA